MHNKKSKMYMICGSLAIIAVAAAVVIAYLFSPANVYARQIASADKYIEQGDYSRAILAYREAIEKDPDSVEAYAGLADVYITRNETDSAIEVLRRGVSRTGSARLRLMLNTLIQDESSPEAEDLTELKSQEAVLLDTATVEIIGSYSYADYSSRYGLAEKSGNHDGSVTCVFNGLDAEFTFSNTEAQPDAVSATVVEARAIPSVAVFRNVLNLFGVNDFITFQTLETLHLTNLHIMDHPTMTKAVQFEQNNVRITIQSDENGNITAGADNTFEPMKAMQGASEDKNLVLATGTVKDAQTGTPVSGAYLAIREGQYQTGTVLDEIRSNTLGVYEFNVDPGEYTIEISADGYTSQFITVFIGSYETTHIQDIVISKTVGSGEARIVLTWGSTPRDLDSYLLGTLDDGTSVFTSFYSQKSGGNAELDLDDTNGNGPETTTIYNLNGVFRFFVLDYTGSGRMNSSGATVSVYLPNQPVQEIKINSGISGNTWCVLEIDHGQLNIVNGANVWGLASDSGSYSR